MSLIAEKKVFHIDSFSFQNGRTLPVQMGYETYGTLNADKSNAILVAHYFSASSHCAGKYAEDDAVSGFWDGLQENPMHWISRFPKCLTLSTPRSFCWNLSGSPT